jgi:hypothetical protein
MARILGTPRVACAAMLTLALIIGFILGPSIANANDGQNMVLGAQNTSESTTSITRTGNGCCGPTLQVSGGGTQGILAESGTDAGVKATTDSRDRFIAAVEGFGGYTGVSGAGTLGVWGNGDAVGVLGEGTHGVEGFNYFENDGIGVYGESDVSGTGVYGQNNSDGNGVYGATETQFASGVSGLNTGDGPGVQGENRANGNGVFGLANNSAASGVYGENDGTGFGVAGRANAGVGLFGDTVTGTAVQAHSESGTAILALTTSGTALAVHGKMTATRSGIVPVGAGKKQVSVQVPDMNAKTFALATIQGPPAGVWVVSVSVASSTKLVIYLNVAPKVDTAVGWFVLG